MNNLNRKEDRYWKVEEVRPYILRYLKEKFPDSIIEREFDRVDLMILGQNIPVEIQKVYLHDKFNNTPHMAKFENDTRKQIEQNISIFGQCWLFFDNKFLEYLKYNINKQVSINMDWLYQFFKSGKLRVFTIAIGEEPKELEDKDFEFIARLSSTCKLGEDEVQRILERNKSKIAYNVYKGNGFTTDEINNWYDYFEKDNIKDDIRFTRWLIKRGGRMKILGNIKSAIGQLSIINNMLKCNTIEYRGIREASVLGILEGSVQNNKYARIRNSDTNNIIEYFPGYFINKELWDYWRVQTIAQKTFVKVVHGEYKNYLNDYKRQKSIEDSWGS